MSIWIASFSMVLSNCMDLDPFGFVFQWSVVLLAQFHWNPYHWGLGSGLLKIFHYLRKLLETWTSLWVISLSWRNRVLSENIWRQLLHISLFSFYVRSLSLWVNLHDERRFFQRQAEIFPAGSCATISVREFIHSFTASLTTLSAMSSCIYQVRPFCEWSEIFQRAWVWVLKISLEQGSYVFDENLLENLNFWASLTTPTGLSDLELMYMKGEGSKIT